MLGEELISKLRMKPQWWTDLIVVPWRVTCTINVLMVSDVATFSGGAGWDLSRVLEAVQHDLPPYLKISVTTATHAGGPQDLRFNKMDLTKFDQIWIFAVKAPVNAGDSLEPGELNALWQFMQGGGGIFATGDHENLGEVLCARIPRVRSMRRWYYPNPGPNGEPVAPSRNVDPNHGENDTVTQGGDMDGVPQTIDPVLYGAPTFPNPLVFGVRSYPHPVLCGGAGPIRVLPDHMHEGVVEVPADLATPIAVDGVNVDEYPRRGAARLAPEVIARSTANNNSAGAAKFGVIGAYDGHLVDEKPGGVGRIVVDSTWHHFFNLNVNQFANAHDAVKAAVAQGTAPLTTDIAPAQAWEQIRDYFQNIAFWLARRGTQDCIRRRGLWHLANHVDIRMALQSSRIDTVGHLIDLGQKARDALGQIAHQCEVIRWIYWPPYLEKLVPWPKLPSPPDPPWKWQVPILDATVFENLVLGAQVTAMADITCRANSSKDVTRLLNARSVDGKIAEVTRTAIVTLTERLRADAGRLDGLIKTKTAAGDEQATPQRTKRA